MNVSTLKKGVYVLSIIEKNGTKNSEIFIKI